MDGSGSCAYAYDTPPQGGSCRWLPRASRCTARTSTPNNTQGGQPIAGNETKGACRRPSRRGEKLDGAPLGEKLDCRPLQCKDKLILSLFVASAEGIRSPIFSAPGLGPRPTRMHAPTHARKWRCASADGSGAKTDWVRAEEAGNVRSRLCAWRGRAVHRAHRRRYRHCQPMYSLFCRRSQAKPLALALMQLHHHCAQAPSHEHM